MKKRILFPYDNLDNYATSLDELPEVVKIVKKEFNKDVQKAVDYFGKDFLDEQLIVKSPIFNLPSNIKQMLVSPDRFDWSKQGVI